MTANARELYFTSQHLLTATLEDNSTISTISTTLHLLIILQMFTDMHLLADFMTACITVIMATVSNALEPGSLTNPEEGASTSPSDTLPSQERRVPRAPLASELLDVLEQATQPLQILWSDPSPAVHSRLNGCIYDTCPSPTVRPLLVYSDLRYYWSRPFTSIQGEEEHRGSLTVPLLHTVAGEGYSPLLNLPNHNEPC